MKYGRPARLLLVLLTMVASGCAVAQVRENLLQKKEKETRRKQVESEMSAAKGQPNPYDLLGIKLGMSMVEAEELVRAHMPVDRVFDLKRAPVLAAGSPVAAYVSGKLFIRNDGRETIALINEPPAADQKVVAVMRTLMLPKGALPVDQALATLRRKYGPETHYAEPNNAPFNSYWIGQVSPAVAKGSLEECYVENYRLNEVVRIDELPWTERGLDRPFNRNREGTGINMSYGEPFQRGMAYTWPLRPRFLATDRPRPTIGMCLPGLLAKYNSIDDADQLNIVLVDHDRYHADFLNSRKMLREAAESPAPAAPAAGPNPNLKL